MNQHKYGGIQADRTTSEESSQDAQANEIVSSWNIAEYLPKATQDYFVVILSEYIFIPWKHAREKAARLAGDGGHISSTPSITLAGAATLEAEDVLFLRDKVTSYFTDKLLRIVRDIQRHMTAKKHDFEDPDVHASRKFPELAGSHLPMGEPALEFIKHVCAVLALDQRVQHDVLVLRKNLLKLVRVKEFSAEAVFRDPCLSFTLPNVICSYCNDCRDLDLCRDFALLEHDWHCVMPQCGQPYDREWVENALLQLVRRRERLFQLQDLVCKKCSQAFFLELYVKMVLNSKGKPAKALNEAFGPLFEQLMHDDFGTVIVPTAVTLLRRNPELIMESVSLLLKSCSLDLSKYGDEFLPVVLPRARHSDEDRTKEAFESVENIATRSSDLNTIDAMFKSIKSVLGLKESSLFHIKGWA